MKRVIATNRPIKHGSRTISKSEQSLAKLVGLDSLPITDEHTDRVLGQAKDFLLRVKNGVTEVLADIPDSIIHAGKGFSLQFQGLLDGDTIDVSRFNHLALTSNPRDTFTFSESEGEDSVVEETASDPEPGTDKTETPKPKELTTDELLALLENPEVQSRLLGLLSVQVDKEETPTEEPKQPEPPKEQAKEPEPVQPIRVVVKPRIAEPQAKQPTKPRVKTRQFKFPAL